MLQIQALLVVERIHSQTFKAIKKRLFSQNVQFCYIFSFIFRTHKTSDNMMQFDLVLRTATFELDNIAKSKYLRPFDDQNYMLHETLLIIYNV